MFTNISLKNTKCLLAILLALFTMSCNQWQSFEGLSEKEVLEIAYKEGVNCGRQFGSMSKCEELLDAATLTYIGILSTQKDSIIYQEFKTQFSKGMEVGVEESPYKGLIVDVENISGTYAGTLGEYDITMTLDQSKSNIDGSYTYTKYGNTLNLSGSINGTEISLNETTPKGNNSANWSLKYVDKTLVGTINVFHTGKTHEVNLRLME